MNHRVHKKEGYEEFLARSMRTIMIRLTDLRIKAENG